MMESDPLDESRTPQVALDEEGMPLAQELAAMIATGPTDIRRGAADAGIPLVLDTLHSDVDQIVRWRVARNLQTPPGALLALAQDPDECVRATLAANTAIDDETFLVLAADDAEIVRIRVGQNPTAPKKILWDLAGDEMFEVRQAVASNPRCPVEILQELALDLQPEVVALVCFNHRMPPDVGQRLRHHSSGVVRYIAFLACGSPEERQEEVSRVWPWEREQAARVLMGAQTLWGAKRCCLGAPH